jgi:Ca2+-binding EF-hand superfamily protein
MGVGLRAPDVAGLTLFADIPASQSVVDGMMKEASKSGSGKVNFNEFVTMMASRMKEMDRCWSSLGLFSSFLAHVLVSERTVLEAFECFDTVGTGTFSIQDFTEILTKAGTGPHLTEREVKVGFFFQVDGAIFWLSSLAPTRNSSRRSAPLRTTRWTTDVW